jgi:hypothetical protein
MRQARRRSAKEWAGLVRKWQRSGQTAARFSARHGLRAASLVWWRWRLKRGGETAPTTGVTRPLQLVPVKIEPEHGGDNGGGAPELGWELVASLSLVPGDCDR